MSKSELDKEPVFHRLMRQVAGYLQQHDWERVYALLVTGNVKPQQQGDNKNNSSHPLPDKQYDNMKLSDSVNMTDITNIKPMNKNMSKNEIVSNSNRIKLPLL